MQNAWRDASDSEQTEFVGGSEKLPRRIAFSSCQVGWSEQLRNKGKQQLHLQICGTTAHNDVWQSQVFVINKDRGWKEYLWQSSHI
jgi:hypothetical protein